ncbi:TPA: hypothetical protein QDA84_003584 [Burkholderia vietnamiensis]|nr:hypothetical protein [Burkholderia vietnamiensis]
MMDRRRARRRSIGGIGGIGGISIHGIRGIRRIRTMPLAIPFGLQFVVRARRRPDHSQPQA